MPVIIRQMDIDTRGPQQELHAVDMTIVCSRAQGCPAETVLPVDINARCIKQESQDFRMSGKSCTEQGRTPLTIGFVYISTVLQKEFYTINVFSPGG